MRETGRAGSANQVVVDGRSLQAVHVETPNSNILLIKAPEGLLGCGYFNVDVANRNGDVMAIVRGVRTPEDMLMASVEEVSDAAEARGVHAGMTGEEALRVLSETG